MNLFAGRLDIEELLRSSPMLRSRLEAPNIVRQQHEDMIVVWDSRCRWVNSFDDGDVLVVVDGILHHVPSESVRDAHVNAAEVLARRYRTVGPRFAEGVLGDFVAVVMDRRAHRLLMARDPVGVRPWFIATSGSFTAAATAIAPLTEISWVNCAVNERTAVAFLANIWANGSETLYHGITTLPPGETLRIEHESVPRSFRHHSWRIVPEDDLTWNDAIERCRSAFDEAVRDRLRTQVPATCELSGGLDSSITVGTVAPMRDDLIVGRLLFEGPRADERQYSQAVIDHWRLECISVPPFLPKAEDSSSFVARNRRPTPLPNFTMFNGLHRALADIGHYETLTGLGGDNAFESLDNGTRIRNSIDHGDLKRLAKIASWTIRNPKQSWHDAIKPVLRTFKNPRPDLPWIADGALRRNGIAEFLIPAVQPGLSPALDKRMNSLSRGHVAAIMQEQAVLHDELDHRSSHPYLDPRVVDATYGLDPWWATEDEHSRSFQVRAFRERLPAVVANRRTKAEFSEVALIFASRQSLEQVCTGPLASAGWLERDGFEKLASGRGPFAAGPIARCIALDKWLRALTLS
jgi:hypothetical protein